MGPSFGQKLGKRRGEKDKRTQANERRRNEEQARKARLIPEVHQRNALAKDKSLEAVGAGDLEVFHWNQVNQKNNYK